MVFKKRRKPCSLEQKKKLSKIFLGREISDEWKSNMSKSHLGKKIPENVRKKISKSMTGKKHKPETIEKIRLSHIGKKNSNWKGGISSENDLIRGNSKIKKWKVKVFRRDDFTCKKYGLKGVKLNAHHIENFSDNPKKRFTIKNGITLSEQAHKEFHKIYGRKNNNLSQLNEFLER